jgi:hypothetical protein
MHELNPSSTDELPFLKAAGKPTNALPLPKPAFMLSIPFFAWWFFPINRGADWIFN